MYYEVNIKVKGRKPAVSVIESQKYQSKKFYGNPGSGMEVGSVAYHRQMRVYCWEY